jgi:D-glycero-D-manno-heptose 1,7-bisphosphate phosphatase
LSERAVFLDRDGVINRARVVAGRPHPPRSLDELEIVPEAAAGLAELKSLGFRQINAELGRVLPIDGFLTCFHDDLAGCDCRKPLPGLLVTGAARYGLDLAASFLIGDRWRDIAAGRQAGVRTVFIDYRYAEPRPDPSADATVPDLANAVAWIVAQNP